MCQNADNSGQTNAKLMLLSPINIAGHVFFTKMKFTISLQTQKYKKLWKKYIAVPIYSFRIHLLTHF